MPGRAWVGMTCELCSRAPGVREVSSNACSCEATHTGSMLSGTRNADELERTPSYPLEEDGPQLWLEEPSHWLLHCRARGGKVPKATKTVSSLQAWFAQTWELEYE